VAIGSCEGPSKKSESVEARYPDILLSDLRSAINNSRKIGRTEKPVLEFRFFLVLFLLLVNDSEYNRSARQ
jgi:hypothetical protein